MKRLLVAGFVLALLVPACAFAQDAFNGTWKMDPASVHQSGGKAMMISLKNGVYSDNSTPPVSIKADGQDHAVTGHPRFDMIAVKVINDHTIQSTEKKDGKTVWSGTFTAADDGKTATGDSTMYNDGSATMTSKVKFDRIGKSAGGSNAAEGSWRMSGVMSASGDELTGTYQVDGDKIDYKSGSGTSYTATLGGKAVPVMDNGKSDGTVSVKRMGNNSLRETYYTDGKVRMTSTMTVSADGKMMKSSNHYAKTGATTTMEAAKQ